MIRLIIAGIEISPISSPFSNISFSRSLAAAVDTARLTIVDPPDAALPLSEKEAYIYNDSRCLFGGIVRAPKIRPMTPALSSPLEYELRVDSWEAALARRYASGAWSGAIADAVVAILADTGLAAAGFTAEIDPELKIGKVVLEATVLDIFSELARLNQAVLTISPEKVIAIRRDPPASPLQFDASAPPATALGTWKSHAFTPDSAALTSVVKIRNAKIISQNIIADPPQLADGVTDVFHVNHQFSGIVVETSPDGASWTEIDVGVEFIDADADFDALYNFNSYYVRFTAPPTSGTHIRAKGRAYYDFFFDYRDEAAVEQLAALTATDGVFEYMPSAADLSGLHSGQDVVNFCRTLIEDRKNVKINGKLVLETTSPPPDPIGQTIRVTDAAVAFQNRDFLVTRYACRFSRPLWVYELSLDAAVFGIEKIVADILRKRGTADGTDTLPLSRAYEEPIVISESCARNLFPIAANLVFDGEFGHTAIA